MTDTMKPHEYQRRILLVVIGMTPQIVTETLYKLAVEQKPAFAPTEVHLITTREGADSARLALLGVSRGQGWLQQFKADYHLPDIQFDESNIHVIADTEGQFIDDNQSTQHNRIAADFITNKVKEFTSDEGCALHVSLAGGRKTMSFYAGYALSLYGRPQDELSHVLVSKEFQNNRDFFYPRPKPERIEINNRYYSTEDARIILSNIPYVRMQQQIPDTLLNGEEGYQETVEKMQRFSEAPSVCLKIRERIIELNTVPVKLTEFEFAYYLWMCERRLQDQPILVFDEASHMPEFIEVLARVTGKHSNKLEKAEEMGKFVAENEQSGQNRFDFQKSYFGPHRSRLERKIKKMLGHKFAQPFLIQTLEMNGRVGYQIGLADDAIHVKKISSPENIE